MRTPAFRPQRLFPRYARLISVASRIPGGVATTMRLVGPQILDPMVSYSEVPTNADLMRAEVAISGFPRTGSTFLQHAFGVALRDQAKCWRNHDALALRRYVSFGLPTIVTLRHPTDTVTSWSMYHDDEPSIERMRDRILVYTAWHREALRTVRTAPVTILRFEDFTTDPELVIQRILRQSSTDLATVGQSAVHHALSNSDHEDMVGEQQRHLPSPQRQALKRRYLDVLDTRQLRGPLGDALDMHERLTERSLRVNEAPPSQSAAHQAA